jgi:hypothetical protein
MKNQASLYQKITYFKHKYFFFKKHYQFLGLTKKKIFTPEFDCLIIGSDEVFNCIQDNWNVGYSPELFGYQHRCKRLISYAASFGNTTFDKLVRHGKTTEIAQLLTKFNAISVRDTNSSKIIERLTGRISQFHFDPVLVYDFSSAIANIKIKIPKEKYLILYAYSGRISIDEAAWIRNYAKQRHLAIYAIGGIQSCADKFINCTALEVILYFDGASEVITDTFHGTILSVITHKRFASIVRRSDNQSYGNEEKLIDLLRRLNLNNQATYSLCDLEKALENEIPYLEVDIIIQRERDNAKRYLLQQIEAC